MVSEMLIRAAYYRPYYEFVLEKRFNCLFTDPLQSQEFFHWATDCLHEEFCLPETYEVWIDSESNGVSDCLRYIVVAKDTPLQEDDTEEEWTWFRERTQRLPNDYMRVLLRSLATRQSPN